MQPKPETPVRPDQPATLAVFMEWAADRFAAEQALRFKTPGGGWAEVTYDRLRENVRSVGRGLIGLGVRPDDRVAILAETRPEWTYAHFGTFTAGAVVVPVYPTAGDEEVTWVLGDSGASVVICENAAQAAKIERLRGELPGVRHVVLMSEAAPGKDLALLDLPQQTPLDDLLAVAESRTNDDLATIIYTSGTTGLPKGCQITHGNIGAVRDGTHDQIPAGPGDTAYLYLPLAHAMAQLFEFKMLLLGASLTFYGGRIEDIVGELAEAKPTHLPSVPRLFEKVHSVVLGLAEGQEGGRERFAEAVRVGAEVAGLRERGEEPTGELLTAWQGADERLFSLVRAAFGGRLKWALTGAAPIAPDTLTFLRACGIAIYEGYGMTESGGVISVNHPGALRYGSVGRPIPGCDVRVGEDGEVLARGANVFPGYQGNPGATAEALDAEGWLHTGDLGHLDEDGYLFITGRKKDLIITSGGKNLTPSLVEFAIQQSRYVSRAVMVGDRRPYPVALITLDEEEVRGWAGRENVRLEEPLARDPRVRELVGQAVAAANEQVSRPARIRAFALLDEDFSIESGLLTPSLKVRRKAVVERYSGEVDELYET
ncbi:AMP-dependent synthetase/ligase [Streptomyces sp. NBC_01304]|uniref:AMP-dependent synthetase/ligase n=1 Tax=Streptomyces sp. NBC_01304 TaxID=2903818 RepID=UPI002E0EDAA8|nr:long-chain fatty acid--CoA ligase [Streptomyces sp. NBC_01304]